MKEFNMNHTKKYYEWSVVHVTKSGKTEIIRGSERKEADAVQKVFALLEDKSFAIHVIDIFVYAMPSGKPFIKINPISKTVVRGTL